MGERNPKQIIELKNNHNVFNALNHFGNFTLIDLLQKINCRKK